MRLIATQQNSLKSSPLCLQENSGINYINYCVPNIFMIACLCHLGNPLLLAYPVKCPGSGKNTSLERERDGS